MARKGIDFSLPQFVRMPESVEHDELLAPKAVGAISLQVECTICQVYYGVNEAGIFGARRA